MDETQRRRKWFKVAIVVVTAALVAATPLVYWFFFALLAEKLAPAVGPVEVTNLACGGWSSVNEIKRVKLHAIPLDPDVILFVDGLNDLSERRKVPIDERVTDYLANMRAAIELTRP